VNKDRNLTSSYVPPDLVVPNVTFSFPEYAEKKNMRREAAAALENLFAAAKANGLTLLAVSGYRSYSTQQVIFNNKVAAVGWDNAVKVSAQPGQSEHQTGWAMDVSCWSQGGNLTTSFGSTPEGIWLANNAHNYGFVIRYQLGKESITGYSYEPWHVRYVGMNYAKAIKSSNLTLDEYIFKIANY
jgi:D-alanyl-D-alanine carboxypeptidase